MIYHNFSYLSKSIGLAVLEIIMDALKHLKHPVLSQFCCMANTENPAQAYLYFKNHKIRGYVFFFPIHIPCCGLGHCGVLLIFI